jgi:hypothetical protein
LEKFKQGGRRIGTIGMQAITIGLPANASEGQLSDRLH